MIYRVPRLQPAAISSPTAPRLRGQDALRIAAIEEISRDAGSRFRAFDLDRDHDLTTEPKGFCGLQMNRPLIMGILNVTPDSFSDGGKFDDNALAIEQALRLVEQGADILDIGGESTRPGAVEVSIDDEIARTAPLIQRLCDTGLGVPISIDTRKAPVARAALEAGARIVNDVSALTWDRDMAKVVALAGAPLCLMHAQGTPQTMQKNPYYEDVRLDVRGWLDDAIARAEAGGLDRDLLIVDPGIGFGKTLEHNLALLNTLALLHETGCAILVGASRKRFIGTLSGVEQAEARVAGSVAVALHAASQGAQIIRVHDVEETRQALAVWQGLNKEKDGVQA